MAGSLIVTDALELETQRKGALGISLTNWTNTNAPQITLGSWIEIAGAVIEFTANEIVDSGAAWAGFAANSTVYGYINGTTYVSVLTTTAPTWNTENQGWYDVTGQHRYYLSMFKDASSGYARKCLLENIKSIYLKEYAYEKDMYSYSTAGVLALSYNSTNNAVSGDVYTTKTFYLKKPVTIKIKSTRVSGDTLALAAYNYESLYISGLPILNIGLLQVVQQGSSAVFNVNPGKYKWISRHNTAAGANQGVRSHAIYLHGAYGCSSLTKSACIDT